MAKWISAGKHGLRYREHEELITGVGRNKRPLRYYTAAFKFKGKYMEDVFGWENVYKGGSTEIESLALQYKMNRKMQTPPFTHKEFIESRKTELAEIEETKIKEQEALQQMEQSKFDIVFNYYCDASEGKLSLRDEKGYYKKWIKPEIGELQLDKIQLLNLERIDKRMRAAGRAPRTRVYIKSIIRQVFNYANKHNIFNGVPPTKYFLEKIIINNQRERYLSPAEAASLLEALQNKSIKAYRITLLSMLTGMRFGDIARLQWQHVNTDGYRLIILDTKNKTSRPVVMNEAIRELFLGMERGRSEDLVFPAKNGKRMIQMLRTFNEVVSDLGLNEGIQDRRMKVVFHTMRHSCASWLAEEGVDIRVIGKVLGQKTIAMTMRYSHLNDSALEGAMKSLNNKLDTTKTENKIISFSSK